jgi:transcriptional regulator with XRE-family HTH domain
MRVAHRRIRRLARELGLPLTALLRRAGISRTAYYSLARRPTVLPKTIHALAEALHVPIAEILEEPAPALSVKVLRRLESARAICAADSAASFENIWHSLCLMDLAPMDRLNRSLIRGRAAALHR